VKKGKKLEEKEGNNYRETKKEVKSVQKRVKVKEKRVHVW
jgi:hypothetical protein